MKTDIQIAQEAVIKPITEITADLKIDIDHLSFYDKDKAKIDYRLLNILKDKPDGKLVLVTAISPTPAGEGKTTTSVGLADAMMQRGYDSILALREPSLGPVFGVKGGAAGGGYAQVIPMEDINLHFTGDLHAIGTANNLLAAMVDNHIQHGNELCIDPCRITWKRCMDMNDRQLRYIVDGLGGKINGTPREDGFDITVASEIMAIFCLATSLFDLKERIANIVIGYSYTGKAVTAGEIGAAGAMAALLKTAFNPNLVQTLEHTPAIIHGGPFANIAHGCNSIVATRLAMKLADYTITEAGFGADLGAEKFLDIKCRKANIAPSCVVVVATIRALKHHGGCAKADLNTPSVELLTKGCSNLVRHIENMRDVYGLPVAVAINTFPTDTAEEFKVVFDLCKEMQVPCALSEVFAKGGKGALELADIVADLCAKNTNPSVNFTYETSLGMKDKIQSVCSKVYKSNSVTYLPAAEKAIAQIESLGIQDLAVCIAKTQYSFSDNAKLLAAPENFNMTVRDVKLSAGAGFAVVIMGDIMTMPGLPKMPAALNIDIDENGNITGLF